MCRLNSCCFGMSTLRTGALLIGWGLLTLSLIALISELTSPWIHKTYQDEYNIVSSLIFISWNVMDIAGNIILLVGVYEERPKLFIMWLVMCVLNMGMTLWDLYLYIKSVTNTDLLFGHIASSAIVIELWIYMYIVVYNYYLDLRGISRGASLINLVRH